jgi:hypothetical protein
MSMATLNEVNAKNPTKLWKEEKIYVNFLRNSIRNILINK